MKRKFVIGVLVASMLVILATTQTVRAGGWRQSGVRVGRWCATHGFQWAQGTAGPLLFPAGVDVWRLVWCGAWVAPDTIAYARAWIPSGSNVLYVQTYTWTRLPWPQMGAWAWGWGWDPPGTANNTIFLTKGITLIQNGSAKARYEITMTDMNTTDVYTYWSQLENGTFTASPNWSGDWTQLPDIGTLKVWWLSPRNITIGAMPENHLGNCSHQAKSTTYIVNSLAIANSTEKPAMPPGGVWVPVDKIGLLAPYIALVSTILIATAATAIYVKRVKRRKEKQ